MLVLWPTGKCNLRCRYCYAAYVPQMDMSWETARAAIDLMAHAPFTLQFAGGEPTLNMNLVEHATDYARRHGCRRIAVQTNATCIDDRVITWIQNNHIAVGVSLDGNVLTNEMQRGRTLCALEGIRMLGRAGIDICLNAVVTDKNVDKLTELVDVAVYLGNVRGIGLDLVRKAGAAARTENEIDAADPKQAARALKEMYMRVKQVNNLPGVFLKLREVETARKRLRRGKSGCYYCYASKGRSFVVLPDGNVYPCGSLVGDSKYHMGNIFGDVRPVALCAPRVKACAQCTYKEICEGNCPSRMLLNGDPSSEDCMLKKAAFDLAAAEIGTKL